jgi:hypothetical protein
MQKLIIRGNPGVRKGGIIEYDGEEYVCFGVAKQGEWHGPDEVMLWCTIGKESEREDYERRNYVPMHLKTESVDAEDLEVVQERAPQQY